MGDAQPPRHWHRLPSFRIFGLLILLISPLGAPAVGYTILAACVDDWETPVRCVSQPIADYFLPFVFMPFFWGGGFIGILWCLGALAILLALIWSVARSAWDATMGRL